MFAGKPGDWKAILSALRSTPPSTNGDPLIYEGIREDLDSIESYLPPSKRELVGEVAPGMHGIDPTAEGEVTKEEIERCQLDPSARLSSAKREMPPLSNRQKGAGGYCRGRRRPSARGRAPTRRP